MSIRIVYLLTGPPTKRTLTARCDDCGKTSPENDPDPYSWGNAHREKGCL